MKPMIHLHLALNLSVENILIALNHLDFRIELNTKCGNINNSFLQNELIQQHHENINQHMKKLEIIQSNLNLERDKGKGKGSLCVLFNYLEPHRAPCSAYCAG